MAEPAIAAATAATTVASADFPFAVWYADAEPGGMAEFVVRAGATGASATVFTATLSHTLREADAASIHARQARLAETTRNAAAIVAAGLSSAIGHTQAVSLDAGQTVLTRTTASFAAVVAADLVIANGRTGTEALRRAERRGSTAGAAVAATAVAPTFLFFALG